MSARTATTATSRTIHRARRFSRPFLVLTVLGASLLLWWTLAGYSILPTPLRLPDTQRYGTVPADVELPVTDADRAEHQVPADQPRLLTIPRLGVSARVLALGLDAKNDIEAPPRIADVGWYRDSAWPGGSGASFFDGHVSGPTQPGVFKKLHELRDGDAVVIERGDGRQLRYRVTATEQRSATDIDMTELLAGKDDNSSSLVLMTCAGPFDPAAEQYERRVIVRAELSQ